MPSVLLAAFAPTLPHLDGEVQQRLNEVAMPAMPMQTLRRTGMRPLIFNGINVAMVSGINPTLPFWYELNVFRTVIDSYVCDVRLFHKTDAPDSFRVAEIDDRDDVLAWFERYRPETDVAVPSRFADTPALRAIECGKLENLVEAQVAHFRALSGQLLSALVAA